MHGAVCNEPVKETMVIQSFDLLLLPPPNAIDRIVSLTGEKYGIQCLCMLLNIIKKKFV